MRIQRNAAFMAQMRSPALNRLSQLNAIPPASQQNVPGMQGIRDKLHNMRVDFSDISPEITEESNEEAKKNAKLTMKEMLAAYLPGGSKHETKLNEGVEGAYQGASGRIDALEKKKEYLSMSEEHAKLAQDTSLTDKERDLHARMADEIKRYVAQSVSGHLDDPVKKDLNGHKNDRDKQMEETHKLYFGPEAVGSPSADGYINDVDVMTGGAIGRLVCPVRGDLSPAALGLDGLAKNYRDVSYQEMKDMITAAQEKIKPAADRLAALYYERTGEQPKEYRNLGQFDPFTADTIKQGERNLFEDMRFCVGFSNFNWELSDNREFGDITLSGFGESSKDTDDLRLNTDKIFLKGYTT